MVQFKAGGVAGVGGGLKVDSLAHFAPGTPGFYGLLIWGACLLIILAVAHSLL